jgi:tRNA modification GTPase
VITYGSPNQTIAAIATPAGLSGIGIVRISGPDCGRIAQALFRPARATHPLPSHRLCYGELFDPAAGRVIDEVMVVFMQAPRTYTREDCLEIQAHGGLTVLSRILQAVLDQGARPANPGEFTLRAFLNGRIDLTQAEAVADLIHASSAAGLELACRQLKGGLSRVIEDVKDQVLDILALLEAQIDFPDENLPGVDGPRTAAQLHTVGSTVADWIASFHVGRICKEGASLMIVGAPNAGKSSLLNALAGCEKAIVTEIPGTTRDMVEARLEWQGLPIRAIDTAGLRAPQDAIEAAGHRLLREKIREVDLVIWIFDAATSPSALAVEPEALLKDTPCVVALNKVDLTQKLFEKDLPPTLQSLPIVRVSAKECLGLETLLTVVKERLLGLGIPDLLLLTNVRHRMVLDRVVEHIFRAQELLSESTYIELAAAELHEAMDGFDEILGEKVDNEVLARIFERFCIGK